MHTINVVTNLSEQIRRRDTNSLEVLPNENKLRLEFGILWCLKFMFRVVSFVNNLKRND